MGSRAGRKKGVMNAMLMRLDFIPAIEESKTVTVCSLLSKTNSKQIPQKLKIGPHRENTTQTTKTEAVS